MQCDALGVSSVWVLLKPFEQGSDMIIIKFTKISLAEMHM
jgi:hypothetical protein